MSNVTIYHNPRCTKSRQTLQLLRDRGIEPEIIEYLKNPPSVKELEQILSLLGAEPDTLIRKKEDVYKKLGLKDKTLGRKELIRIMSDNPVLIERPIVIKGQSARVGRPPESVLEIL